jgi:hypothetical protein
MQAADLGDSHDGTERRRLNAPRDRCIPLQGEMRPGRVVVVDVFPENPPEVVLVEDRTEFSGGTGAIVKLPMG